MLTKAVIYLYLFVSAKLFRNSYACADITSRRIFAAIIVDGGKGIRMANFTAGIFSGIDRGIFPETEKLWTNIVAPPCVGLSKGDRGLNIVHREIIHDFFLRKGTCDALIVLEGDAFPAHPEAAMLSIESVQEMTADFLWLGYFYRKKDGHPLQTNHPPSSSHAYAVTHNGASKLHSFLDACKSKDTGFLSVGYQVQALAFEGKISWAVPRYRESALPTYLNKQLEKFGLHLSTSLFSDGLFVQVNKDRDIQDLPDGTVGHVHGRKSIWYLFDREWRPVGSMDNFFNLGLDLKNVVTFTKAQLRTFPVGPTLTPADVEDILKKKRPLLMHE